MIDLPPDRLRTWLVFESGQRWTDAARRFAPELMPSGLTAQVKPFHSPITTALLGSAEQARAIVLWQTGRANFAEVCDGLAQTRKGWPGALQLAAIDGLAARHLFVLSEIGAATFLSHPEQLPALAAMTRAHFSRAV